MAVDSAYSNRILSLKFTGDTLSVSALISLVTLIFDLFISNLVPVIARGWATFLPILVFLGLFVLDLWANTCQYARSRGLSDRCWQTDHVTLRP